MILDLTLVFSEGGETGHRDFVKTSDLHRSWGNELWVIVGASAGVAKLLVAAYGDASCFGLVMLVPEWLVWCDFDSLTISKI